MNIIHSMSCRNPHRLYIYVAFTCSVGPLSLGPHYTRSQGRFEAKSLLPIGWSFEISPKAFTQGVKTESRKIILMFKRQDVTQPQLQELGPPRMEGQFVVLGPLWNFIKIWFFSLKFFFDKRSSPEDGLEIWTALLGPLFLYLLFLSFSISLTSFIPHSLACLIVVVVFVFFLGSKMEGSSEVRGWNEEECEAMYR